MFRQLANYAYRIRDCYLWASLGIGQEEMAGRLRVDPGTLARWEKGRGTPSPRLQEIIDTHFRSPGGDSLTD